MNLLLHICCGNCLIYPAIALKDKGIKFEGLWFNPNIAPVDEYEKRLSALREYQAKDPLPIHHIDSPAHHEYLQHIAQHPGKRCSACYEFRLDRTAKSAKEMGFDAFSTTLMVSPYQDFDSILRTGAAISSRYGIEFLGMDFRDGYKEGVRISRALGLYRQWYCGCLPSRDERLLEKAKKARTV